MTLTTRQFQQQVVPESLGTYDYFVKSWRYPILRGQTMHGLKMINPICWTGDWRCWWITPFNIWYGKIFDLASNVERHETESRNVSGNGKPFKAEHKQRRCSAVMKQRRCSSESGWRCPNQQNMSRINIWSGKTLVLILD